MHTPSSQSATDISMVAPFRRRGVWLILGAVLLIALFTSVGLWVWNSINAPSPPVAMGLRTAHTLEGQAIIGETRVFASGQPVTLIAHIAHQTRTDAVSVHITGAVDIDTDTETMLTFNAIDNGWQSISFTPGMTGTFTATLYLNALPVVGEQTIFKVTPEGSKLQDVLVSRSVDATYHPTDLQDTFYSTDVIYITYRILQGVAGDTVRIISYLDGKKQRLDTQEMRHIAESGNFRGYFAMKGRNNGALQSGIYRAEVFYNTDLVAVVQFTVVEE